MSNGILAKNMFNSKRRISPKRIPRIQQIIKSLLNLNLKEAKTNNKYCIKFEMNVTKIDALIPYSGIRNTFNIIFNKQVAVEMIAINLPFFSKIKV